MSREEHVPRTDEDLRKASDWLIYEYWMLKGLGQLLREDRDLNKGSLLRNAVLDSFLIHARTLVSFFYRAPQYKTDAVARHYFEKCEGWESNHSGDPKWFEGIRPRTNKALAHIAYDRRKGTWDWAKIEQEIDRTFNDFVEKVPVERLGKRWEKTKFNRRAGCESPLELPDFLIKDDWPLTSFYPEPDYEYYPDERGDDS